MTMTRREFFERCRDMSIILFGCTTAAPLMAKGLTTLAESDKPRVMFVQGQCCTGCSVSLTYGNESGFMDFITQVIRLQVHPNLSFGHGNIYRQKVEEMKKAGGYTLVLEGAVPTGEKNACRIFDDTLYNQLEPIIKNAATVVLSGTCSCAGGVPASMGNVTGAVSSEKYIQEKKLTTPYVKIPGCPVHPDRLMGTVAYIVATGKLPELVRGTPKQYYPDLIHNLCGRFPKFSEDKYTTDYTQPDKCLLKKGCRGPITYSDCPTRRWNGKVNVCIESNAPCIGCINPLFPFQTDIYLNPGDVTSIPLTNTIKSDNINKNSTKEK